MYRSINSIAKLGVEPPKNLKKLSIVITRNSYLFETNFSVFMRC